MIDKEKNPDFLNAFLDYSTSLNKSQNSVKEYNYDLKLFFKFMMIHFKLTNETDYENIDISNFSFSTLKKITQDDIYAFTSYLASEHRNKAATRARKISTIRIFFKYLSDKAEKKYRIDTNPAQNIETPKLDKRLPNHLSLDDSKKLLSIAANEDNRNKERDFAIITLFLNCGMRLSELVSIDIKDIDFQENKLTVIGKGNKERTIYLNKACINAINDYLVVRPREGVKRDSKHSEKALFLSEQKKRISNRTVQHIVNKELSQAGLDTSKYSVHKLRHTAATLMYQYGNVDIRALQ